jgi:DNA-binding transcriptional ArsR family regulator
LVPSKITDDERILSELNGNVLLVYWYLLKKGGGSSGVREVQKALGFSSPSTASYHLEKLVKLGLLKKDSAGNYTVTRIVKVSFLRAFVFVRGLAIPKHAIYATITTIMLLLSVNIFVNTLTLATFAALLPGLVAAIVFWYETILIWRQRPMLK